MRRAVYITRALHQPDGVQSGPGLQPRQGYRHQPANRGLGRQAARGCQGVEAVACELVRRDIISDFAVSRRLVQEIAHQAMKVLMRPGDVLALMQKRR